MNTIMDQKLEALVLKVDFIKAYDRVDWEFLRMILYNIWMDRNIFEWIMGCVSKTSMAVLINGFSSRFFKPGKG